MGFLPSSGGGGGGGAMALLYDLTIGVGGGTFDQTLSGADLTGNDLLLIANARGTNASAGDNLDIRFNNDSAAHYGTQWVIASGAAATANQNNSGTRSFAAVNIPAASATAGLFGQAWIYIPEYGNTNITQGRHLLALAAYSTAITAGGMNLDIHLGFWNQSAAITRIQVFADTTANLAQNSRLRIYKIT